MSSILSASNQQLQLALEHLKASQLPTQGIDENTELYVLEEDYEIIGTIAIEYDNTAALLRSLSVISTKRGNGYGEKLVDYIEGIVNKKGIPTIYLLTTTAAEFFAKKGYQTVSRAEVPPFIRQTSEYCSICPASATVMKKEFS